jgi:hypothetical protein
MKRNRRIPDPLEWHPAYSGMVDLLMQFLEDDSRNVWLVPRVPRISYDWASKDPEPVEIETWELRKERAAGSAPYVGRPFAYTWTVATDAMGRAIATDAKIMYLPPSYHHPRWPDDYA